MGIIFYCEKYLDKNLLLCNILPPTDVNQELKLLFKYRKQMGVYRLLTCENAKKNSGAVGKGVVPRIGVIGKKQNAKIKAAGSRWGG